MMRGRKSALRVVLDEPTRTELMAWLRAQKTPVGLAKRAWAILLVSQGHGFAGAGRQVGMAQRHVRKWVVRFVRDGLRGLFDGQRPGRPPVFSPRSGSASGQDGLRIAG
jgi:Winged helix-turn helix